MTSRDREQINARAKALNYAGRALEVRNPSYFENGIYRHWKGGLYWLLEVARDAETVNELDRVMVYTNLVADANGWFYLYTRSYKDFTADVECDGKVVPRFTWVGYTLPAEE